MNRAELEAATRRLVANSPVLFLAVDLIVRGSLTWHIELAKEIA